MLGDWVRVRDWVRGEAKWKTGARLVRAWWETGGPMSNSSMKETKGKKKIRKQKGKTERSREGTMAKPSGLRGTIVKASGLGG